MGPEFSEIGPGGLHFSGEAVIPSAGVLVQSGLSTRVDSNHRLEADGLPAGSTCQALRAHCWAMAIDETATSQCDQLQIAKTAIEDAATMQYLEGPCRSRFTSPNLSSPIRGGHERSSKRIRRFAS